MWLAELEVRGFKHLSDRWQLGSGLTLVTGPNESGKSTLHEVIVRTLCGFSKSERRKQYGKPHSLKDLRRPWSGAPFAVNARLEGVRDHGLLIEWDFEPYEVTVRNAATGEDLSERVRGKGDEIRLGEYLFELGLDEYMEVCCLHQSAVKPVRQTEELTLLLRRSIESGAEDVGVEDADARLREYLRDRLGVHGGHYGTLPGGELGRLNRERQEKAALLEETERARGYLADEAAKIERLRRQQAEIAQKLQTARQCLLVTRLHEVEDKLRRARELATQAEDRPSDPVRLPPTVDQQVRSRLGELGRLRQEQRRLESEVTAAESKVADLELRRREIHAELDGLAAYEEIDPSQEQAVRDALARIGASTEASERPAVPQRDAALERYRRERSRLFDLAGSQRRATWNPIRLTAAVVVAAVSLAAGLVVHPAALTGLLVAAGLAATARTVVQSRDLQATLSSFGVASLDELEQRLLVEERRIAEAEGALREWDRRRGEATGTREEAERELNEALDRAGARRTGDLQERGSAYLAACGKLGRVAELKAELGELEMKLANLRQPGRDLEDRRSRRAELARALEADCARLGIEGGDEQAVRERFEELVRRAEAHSKRIENAEAAERARSELLAQESLERLERRRVDLELGLREHRAAHGSLATEADDADSLSTTVDGLRAELSALEREIADREGAARERESRLADPAELKERLAEIDERLERMEAARDAIRVAREELAEAAREAHQDFAPHLNAALRDNLAHITGERYRDATVDEELNISVRAPETGKLVPVDELSRGTQDQIYLVERLELARLLDPTTGEAPLLLDDPFARFDDARLRYGLEVLRDVAAARQVILFSEDAELADLARGICGECRVIELRGPKDQRAVAAA